MKQPSIRLTSKTVIIGAVVIVFAMLMLLFSTFNNIQKTSTDRETELSAQYLDNQNELSNYVTKIKEQLQIADRKTDKLDKVLSDAVAGQFGNAQQIQGSGPGTPMFSALVEAYPQLGTLDIYDKVIDSIAAGRDAFKNKQTKLLDQLRAYDRWRQRGIINSWLANLAGVPSDRLVAHLGDQVLTGKAAEGQMYRLVLTKETTQSFKTGEGEPMDLNPSSTAPR